MNKETKNGAYIRCINKSSGRWIEIPVAGSNYYGRYAEIAEMSSSLDPENSIITGKINEYDYWIKLYYKDGEVFKGNTDENRVIGGVIGADPSIGCLFDCDTHKIVKIVFAGNISKLSPYIENKEEVVKEFGEGLLSNFKIHDEMGSFVSSSNETVK